MQKGYQRSIQAIEIRLDAKPCGGRDNSYTRGAMDGQREIGEHREDKLMNKVVSLTLKQYFLALNLAVLTCISTAYQARADYFPIDFSSQANFTWSSHPETDPIGATGIYFPGGPVGNVTLGGIPFKISSNTAGHQAWNAYTALGGGSGQARITINVGYYGVTNVYTLINTYWTSFDSLASLIFTGSKGASYTYPLLGGSDISNWSGCCGHYINGTSTVNVYMEASSPLFGAPGFLDMQNIVLPSAFATQTLETITLIDNGGTAIQRVILDGITVASNNSHFSLISNGSFEIGANPGPSFTTLPPGSTAMTNWVVTSGTVDYIGPYWTAAAGQRSVDLNGNDPGAISQAFKTQPGTTYAVRFAMAGNPDGPPATKRLQVSAAGESAELTFNTEGHSYQDMGYEKRTVLFTATNPQTTLAFTTLTPGPYGPAIDDVTVNETALGNVDNQVRFTPDSRSYQTTADVTGCPSGFVGKFSFAATLGAKPTGPPLSDLVVKVAQLSNGNLLQNADGGPSGVGGLLTVPRDLGPSYSDGVLTHGENIQHIPFTICLTNKTPFTFFVDVLGEVKQ